MTRKRSELRAELEKRLEHLLTNKDVSPMNLNGASVAEDAEFFQMTVIRNGLEEETVEFLEKQPDASIEMVWDFLIPLLPTIEIVEGEDVEE